LALLLAGGTMWSCQKDDVATSYEEGLMLKGGTVPFTWTDVCADQEITFTVTGTGQKQIRMWDGDEWIQVASAGNSSNPLTYTTTLAAGTYYFGYKLGATFYPSPSAPVTDGFEVEIDNCCVPGFTYIDNEDGTYTFTLVPEEDLDNAELVFTFAQSYQSGLSEEWEQAGQGQTMQTTMNLVACETYEWTVTLVANCSGNSGQSNVWTDFKINDISQKADPEDKFIQDCD
jgi:hypothetical protein